jgi:Tfp pilus assembly protein PilN
MSKSFQSFNAWLQGLTNRQPESNLVLKLAPNYWLLSEVYLDKGKPFVKNLIHSPLPRQVDPNKPNIDLEILQDTLIKLVDANGFDGRDVTILLPSSCSVTHTHEVPFDLEKKADIKEFGISAQEKEFWQEFEPEVQDCKSPIFGAQYLGPGSEEGSSQVFMSWANQELLNKYIDLALTARLNPVALIPELQAVFNLLMPQLDRLEREGYFGLLHLARGRSKLLAIGPEHIATANLNISDLDEELLDEIESVDDVSGEFWAEVGARLGSSLKQATMYLREQEGIPPIRNIYVISEATHCENILSLIKANFNLGSLKGWQPLNQLAMDRLATAPATQAIPNQTAWASMVGGGLQGLQASKLTVASDESPRFQLNLHPQRDRLFNNRQYRRIAKKSNWTSFAFASIFACWLVLDAAPTYFRLDRVVSSAQSDLQNLNAKKMELESLNVMASATQSQIEALNRADQENAKSRFVMTLPSLLPNGVELSEMSVNDMKISISGVAVNSSGAQTFLGNINNAKLIKSPLLELTRAEEGRVSFLIEGQTGAVN